MISCPLLLAAASMRQLSQGVLHAPHSNEPASHGCGSSQNACQMADLLGHTSTKAECAKRRHGVGDIRLLVERHSVRLGNIQSDLRAVIPLSHDEVPHFSSIGVFLEGLEEMRVSAIQ